MAVFLNKWILILILALSTIIICKADDKPIKNKCKNFEISNCSLKSKLNRGLNDKEDTLVYDKMTGDTLIFDDKTTDDTLIFADDEIKPPEYENFKQYLMPENQPGTTVQNVSFSVTQNFFSGEIIVKIEDNTYDFFQIVIISIDGKQIVNKREFANNTVSENLKSGIYYIYIKTGSTTNYKKILVK
ncbi:MAG: T9SS type A sorting domain-containing protein [Bacteroidetes bacterium]|nr:T9SS type A sorting domain-containing protein [Bacteroidota bacterium]